MSCGRRSDDPVWAHLLRSGRLDAGGTTRAIETIDRNARLQAQLINDLLDVSRINAGKLELDVYLVDPAAAVEAAVSAVRPDADAGRADGRGGDRPRPGRAARRPRPPPAGDLEPPLERHQVHAPRRPHRRSPGTGWFATSPS